MPPPRYCYFAVQKAATFTVVHGNVDVVPTRYRILAEYGVAMVTMVVHRVLAISKILPDRIGKKFVLRRGGPVAVARGIGFVGALHLLQEYNVCADAA